MPKERKIFRKDLKFYEISNFYKEENDKLQAEIDLAKPITEDKVKALNKKILENKPKIKSAQDSMMHYFYVFKTSGYSYFPFRDQSRFSSSISREIYENNMSGKMGKLLNNFSMYIGDSGRISFFTEVYKDYFWGVRMSVGTTFNTKVRETKSNGNNKFVDSAEVGQAAFQRILAGGGNISINLWYPIFVTRSSDENFRLIVAATSRPTFDLPQLGTYTRNFAFKTDFGLESGFVAAGFDGKIAILGNLRTTWNAANPAFLGQVAYPNIDKARSDGFWIHQFSFGVAIDDFIRISYSGFLGKNNHFSKLAPNSISLTLVPK
jgi:hypothetical protein